MRKALTIVAIVGALAASGLAIWRLPSMTRGVVAPPAPSFGRSVEAQAPPPQVVTPAMRFYFDQTAGTQAEAQSYTYRIYSDNDAGRVLTATCGASTTGSFPCSAGMLAYVDGQHSVQLTTANGSSESVRSATLVFTFKNNPTAPGNFRIAQAVDVFPVDTWINIDDVNHVSDPRLVVYTWPDRVPANAALLKFPVTLPAGSVVQSATLFVTMTDADASTAAYRVTVYQLTRSFDPAAATGYKATATEEWSTASCCSIPLAQSNLSQSYGFLALSRTKGQKRFNVAAAVQSWVDDSASNFGLVLNPDVTVRTGFADRFRTFVSTDDPNVNDWPFLRILYVSA